MKATNLTDNNLDKIIQSGNLILVDFWSATCGPCFAIAPIMDQLAMQYYGKAIIGKINVETNRFSSMKYRIRQVPTLLLFKDRKLIEKIMPPINKTLLESRLNEFIVASI